MATIYMSASGITDSNIMSISVSQTHGSPTAIATIEVKALEVTLGDAINVDIGYSDAHKQMFTGYVKSIEHTIPDNTYIITANNTMIRAIDFFIVSSDPESPLTYENITAETLVSTILDLAGITSVDADTTSFTFGVSNSFEVNQISSYDFCKSVADLLAWTLWCDENGTVHFKNRKPFAMSGSEPQPGWTNDTAITYTWSDTKTLDITYGLNETDLRNRVVVYGTTGVEAEAKDDDSIYFHWKTAVLADASMITDNSMAQDIADYNLHLLNRVSETVSASVIGDTVLLPFRTVHVDSTKMEIDEDYYIYSVEHSITRSGYITRVELRK